MLEFFQGSESANTDCLFVCLLLPRIGNAGRITNPGSEIPRNLFDCLQYKMI